MNTNKGLIDQDDDDINPFEDDSFVPKVVPGMKPFDPEQLETPHNDEFNGLRPYHSNKPIPGSTTVFSRLSPYFQTDETMLKQKIVTALKLGELRTLRDQESDSNIQLDLYSTVWVTATVIMVLFLSYSGKSVFKSLIKNSYAHVTDFQTMINCFLLFYFYVLGVPMLAYAVCQFFFKETFDVITALDTYGISNVVWVPIGLISVLSGLGGSLENVIEWVLVLIGGAYSGAIIYIQLSNVVLDLQNGKTLLYGMIGLHVFFTIMVKVIIL